MKRNTKRNTSPRAFIIAATGSGAGKTTVTLGMIAALRKRGLIVQPFKAGPDYIDPGFHRAAAGRPSYNLDTWMMGAEGVRKSFFRYSKGAHAAVIEGVMGLFDGRDGINEEGSTGHLAKALGVPVLLVVNAEKTARSVAAVVKGFEGFDPGVKVKWVIFNRVAGQRHFKTLKHAVNAHSKVSVIGYLPKDDLLSVPSRHLGLVLQEDIEKAAWRKFLRRLSSAFETNVDVEGFLRSLPAAKNRGGLERARKIAAHAPPARIAVARDRAFCFYYEENLDILKHAGAEVAFFSPLKDSGLPAGTSGVYLGGGYPEGLAGELSANAALRAEIKSASDSGMPIFAECGGLMYLSKAIKTIEGKRHAMAGVFPWTVRMLKKRKALGYREVVVRGGCPFLGKGSVLKGHEFHYSEIVKTPGAGVSRVYGFKSPDTGRTLREGYLKGNTLASYAHIHFASNPGFASGFIEKCREFSLQKNRPNTPDKLKDPQRMPARPGDLKRSCLDSKRALSALGWAPKINLGKGIELTVKWRLGVKQKTN